MERLLADLTHAGRRLARAPGFTTVAILTLALGIGANTAIFSLIRTVLLRPLPYGAPEQLVMLWGNVQKGELTWHSGPEIAAYSSERSAFAGVAAYYSGAANLTGGQDPERVTTAAVTPNLFETLGVPAFVGRTFAAGDVAAEIQDQVVISHGLWQRRYGGRADLVGQTIELSGNTRTVIGIMPATFRLPLEFGEARLSDVWMPLDLRTESWAAWGNHSLIAVARLAPGVSVETATGAMRRLETEWVRDGNWTNADLGRRAAIPMRDLVIGDVRYALWVLFGAVSVILLIACANVANLMLARSDDRHREVAVRAALGASRPVIIRQLLTESTLIGVLGGALGIGVAFAGIRTLLLLQPRGIPRIGDASLDGGVLFFAAALALFTGLLFGLAPALELSRPDLNRSLKEGGRSGTVGRGRQRFRDGLAVAQMAFSVVLLVGAVLLIRSFVELRRIDLGFSERNALTLRTTLTSASYPTDDDVVRMVETLRQRFAQIPGVQSVGATRLLPLTATIGDWTITIEGKPTQPGENPNGDWQVVTPGYFETMGMRLASGRFFEESDRPDGPPVAVINEVMAKRYWPDEDAVGKRFHLGTDARPWITIVGVVGEVRHNTVTDVERAEMYIPHGQWPGQGSSARREMTYILKTAGDPLAALAHAREAVRSLDARLPIADVRTLADVTAGALAEPRFTTMLLALFAALALSLAAIGIYGVIALLVTRRQQEIGIRMALGARPGMVLGMVVRRGMTLAGIGVVAGLAAAALLTRVVASMLYGVTPFDPATFAIVPLILGSVALLACLIPAARAARLDPIRALREE